MVGLMLYSPFMMAKKLVQKCWRAWQNILVCLQRICDPYRCLTLKSIQRAFHPFAAFVQYMSVDHGGFHI